MITPRLMLHKIAMYPSAEVAEMVGRLSAELNDKIRKTSEYSRLARHTNQFKRESLDFLTDKTLPAAVSIAVSLPKLIKDYVDWSSAGGNDQDKKKLINVDLAVLNAASRKAGLGRISLDPACMSEVVNETQGKVSYWNNYPAINAILKQFVNDNLKES